MGLPRPGIPESVVTIGDQEVKVRGLTQRQGRALRDHPSEQEADALCIAWGTGEDVAEARAFMEEVGAIYTQKLINTIMSLSGMGKGAEFPGPKTDDAVVQRPAVDG